MVVKGHPAHPQTGALVAEAIHRAVAASALPEGVFSHLVGPGNDLGSALVQDPRIAAVGFTGSRGGGLALLKLAQARPVPIPVYAEMSSINPVLLMPAALKARGTALGTAFVGSLTMGAGQFCTNPGLLLAIEGEGLAAFVAAATGAVAEADSGTMLTTGIHAAYEKGTKALADHQHVETHGRQAAARAGAQGGAHSRKRLADGRRGHARNGAWRTLPCDVGRAHDFGWQLGNRSFPATSVVPEPCAGAAAARTSR